MASPMPYELPATHTNNPKTPWFRAEASQFNLNRIPAPPRHPGPRPFCSMGGNIYTAKIPEIQLPRKLVTPVGTRCRLYFGLFAAHAKNLRTLLAPSEAWQIHRRPCLITSRTSSQFPFLDYRGQEEGAKNTET